MVDLEEGLLIEVHEGSRGTTKLTAPLGSGEGLFGHKGASAIPLDDGFATRGLPARRPCCKRSSCSGVSLVSGPSRTAFIGSRTKVRTFLRVPWTSVFQDQKWPV